MCSGLTATETTTLFLFVPLFPHIEGLPYVKTSNREQISSNFCAHLSPHIASVSSKLNKHFCAVYL